jgi:ribosomal protein S6--L-glutamate ligase
MKIGILGWDAEETESVGLAVVGRERGHQTTLFTLDDIAVRWQDGELDVTVQGESARDRFDVVMSRAELRPESFQSDHERFALLSTVPGLPMMDAADRYLSVECKLIAMRTLGQAGLPIVPTRSCRSLEEIGEAVGEWGRVVIKPCFGYGGHDVERVADLADPADRAIAERLLAAYPVLQCQPYLDHPGGDIRVTVVGDRLPLTFRRIPPGGERWRANTMQGAKPERIETPPELVEMALTATRAMGITVSGLDVLDTPHGYFINEVNNTPGWYMFPDHVQREVIAVVYELVEERYAVAA